MRGVVGVDQRMFARGCHPQHVHRRDSGGGDRLADFFILNACDNAVAVPVSQPDRDGFLQAVGFEEGGPVGVLPDVAGDAAQDFPARRQRRFHDERDVKTPC